MSGPAPGPVLGGPGGADREPEPGHEGEVRGPAGRTHEQTDDPDQRQAAAPEELRGAVGPAEPGALQGDEHAHARTHTHTVFAYTRGGPPTWTDRRVEETPRRGTRALLMAVCKCPRSLATFNRLFSKGVGSTRTHTHTHTHTHAHTLHIMQRVVVFPRPHRWSESTVLC